MMVVTEYVQIKDRFDVKRKGLSEIFVPCSENEATHVQITDTIHCGLANVTYGGIYKYMFDSRPEEITYYIKNDVGELLYDFEVFLECEYFKEV